MIVACFCGAVLRGRSISVCPRCLTPVPHMDGLCGWCGGSGWNNGGWNKGDWCRTCNGTGRIDKEMQ